MYFAYTEGYLLFGTEPEGFASVFSALDGEPLEESLATNDDYLELMERCGEEGDLQAAVLLTNLADTFLQMDTSGMGMTLLPMAKTVIGDIDGLAQTVSFSSSKDTILEGKYTILMRDGRKRFDVVACSRLSPVNYSFFRWREHNFIHPSLY